MKRINNLLFKLMLLIIPLTVLVVAYSWSISALGNYIYQNTSAPFLVVGGTSTPHKQKLTTQPLHIEYTVLKVPSGKQTAAKK